ncbi:MAG: tricorn protease, partial [Planctomycetota bacterium]
MTRAINRRLLAAITLGCLACSAQGATSNATTSNRRGASAAADSTRMLSQPAISGDQIAFTYLGDLWTSKLDGSGLLRLTTVAGSESQPYFSPDGQTIAFSANYDGNVDVYTIPAAGGEPTRLTWHPGTDGVRGFSPDGKRVLFGSQRAVYWRTMLKLYTVSVDGGHVDELPIPSAFMASFAPDGKRLAYTPQVPADGTWKNYRGGRTSRIWICTLDGLAVEEIPQPEGRCNDTSPVWIGNTLYFRSDRDGEYNLFKYEGGSVTRLTSHEDFPILSVNSDGTNIVYEQAGWLHQFKPSARSHTQLDIHVPAEGLATRSRFVKGAQHIRNAHISPSGKRAVFEFRGEILTLPAKKGNQRNLTNTTGTHERSPAWSPDGKWIAYFSDASGEYQLHLAPSDGQGEVRVLQPDGHGFYANPNWSPDSKKLSYTDNAVGLYIIDVESGDCTLVSSEPYYGPSNLISSDWSPDSRWLAHTQGTDALQSTIQIYELESGNSSAVTDGLGMVGSPVFDSSGKYLYFTASTDAGRSATWFAMSNADARTSNQIYMAVLDSATPSPFAPESDEESYETEDEESDEKVDEPAEEATEEVADAEEAAEEEEEEEEEELTKIDFEGLDTRILHLGAKGISFGNLDAGAEGKLYYLSTAVDRSSALAMYDLKERKETSLAKGVSGFGLSADLSQMIVVQGGKFLIAATGAPVAAGKGVLASDSLEVKIDPRAEWKQIFHESWRINRDYFYDPDMHGADWPAMRAKYAAFLPHLRSRTDLNRVQTWLFSELAVGHHNVGGGDLPSNSNRVSGGLLGADYEVNADRYRFAKIYGGLNWNPGLRSPLTQPGVNVKVGEYLLAINGTQLHASNNLHEPFENTVGKTVELEVGPNADGSESRTIQVNPVGNDGALRNRDWVEGNYQRVTEATNGRVAYVHVPDTGGGGHQYFKRYFFPQADRDALIVDDRHNRGGQVADYVIDHMRRPYVASWATRYGKDLVSPRGSIDGPNVMLINEHSSSGGDLLPWMFQHLELGTLVGRR